MSTANPSRLSVQQENDNVQNVKDEKTASMLKIISHSPLITPLNLRQTPTVSQSPSQLSYIPRRPVVCAAPSYRQQQECDQVNSSVQEYHHYHQQQQQSELYGESPIPSPHQHHQAVTRLFQLNESESGSPVVYEEAEEEQHHYHHQQQHHHQHQHHYSGVERSSVVHQHQQQQQGHVSANGHYNASAPFERLLPHHHEQIREQLKILPPPQYSSRPPVIIDGPSITGAAASVSQQHRQHQQAVEQQRVVHSSTSHHSHSSHHHRINESHAHSHHSQVQPSQEWDCNADSQPAPPSPPATQEWDCNADSQPSPPPPPATQEWDCNADSQPSPPPQPSQEWDCSAEESKPAPPSPPPAPVSPKPQRPQSRPQSCSQQCKAAFAQTSSIQRVPFDPKAPLDIPGSIPFKPELIIDSVSTQQKGRFKDRYEQYKVRQYDVYYITIKGPIENMLLEPNLKTNEFKVLVN